MRSHYTLRSGELDELTELVRGGSQHALVLGDHGMGKTTLLRRLADRVRQDEPDLAAVWLPVRFDEEQYNIGDLADFWLNTLRMISVAVGDLRWRREANALASSSDGEHLEEAARRALHDASQALDRRLLLLVDNVDQVIDRIGGELAQTRLREVLLHERWLLLVGTSPRSIEATYDYKQPLYQQLRIIELGPVDTDDMLRMLQGLAHRDHHQDVADRLDRDRLLLAKLNQIFGGTPRTIALMYDLWRDHGPGSGLRSLEALLHAHTGHYLARIERLAPQSQRVFDALAQRWQAATAEQIASELRLARGPVSAQLNRLCQRGLIDKTDVGERAAGYQIRERPFNLWCLMRGSRRNHHRLRGLSEWLELRYAPDQTGRHANPTEMPLFTGSPDHLSYAAEPGPTYRPLESGLALIEEARRAEDDPTLFTVAQRAHRLADRQPDGCMVHAAVCIAEARLGRIEPMVRALETCLSQAPPDLPRDIYRLLADLIITAGAQHAGRVAAALEGADLRHRFVPIADALRIHAGDESHQLRLPPERLDLAADVLAGL